jgi:hypothetical protein
MSKMNLAKIGILIDREIAEKRWRYGLNVFEYYIGELLAQSGISYEWIDSAYHIQDGSYDIVIAGPLQEKENDVNHNEILKFLQESAGIVISYAGLNALAKKLGFIKGSKLTVGYAELDERQGQLKKPLRYLHGRLWVQDKQQAKEDQIETTGRLKHENPDGKVMGPLLQRFHVGKGKLDRWSVNIPETIVALQQGSQPVLEDGVPAPDGSGKVNEGLLKADDQIEMDWELDRMTTETGAVYFAHAYADLWRETLVQHLIQCAFELGKTLPFVGYWPEGIKGIAMISHDSDSNIDASAVSTLESLKEEGIRSTWCMIKPGYSHHVHDRIKNDGHELALHYNANHMHGGKWSKDEFDRQFKWMQKAAGNDVKIYSNKNHYTRFEGWGELFEWCESNGIESDETRGPSKKGNVGFIFGTCHPYFPISWANEHNRTYDVVEIGFLTQDIPAWTDFSVVEPFMEEVKRVQGIAHFLFHQIRIYNNAEVKESLHKVIQAVKKHDFAFWTGAEINKWVRKRRKVEIVGLDEQGKVTLIAEDTKDIKVWVPICPANQERPNLHAEEQFGFWCNKQVVFE